MATRKLELKLHEGIETDGGGVFIEGGSEAKVFEVNPDTKLLIMVLKSNDVSESELAHAQVRLRSQLQRHGIDGMLFSISPDDDFLIYEEK